MQKKTSIMQIARLAALAALSCSVICAQAPTQTPAKKGVPGQHVTTLITKPEVRVLKTELEPGTAIPTHTHNDVKFYLFLTITSGIELTIGTEPPVLTEAGQAYFILPGTPYSMRNPGTITASAFEVMVTDPTAAPGQRSALPQSGSFVPVSFSYGQAPAGAQAPAGGQAPAGRGRGAGGNAEGGGEGGSTISRLIDRSEVRILRNEVKPGQVHGMHQHDDVQFHLLMAITPGIELTIGTDKPVMMETGQVYFFPRGTQHAFRNPGTVPAVVYEVFINEGPTAPATLSAIKNGGTNAVMALLATNGTK